MPCKFTETCRERDTQNVPFMQRTCNNQVSFVRIQHSLYCSILLNVFFKPIRCKFEVFDMSDYHIIIIFCSRWMWAVSFTLWRRNCHIHWIGGWMDSRDVLVVIMKKSVRSCFLHFIAVAGNEGTTTQSRSACPGAAGGDRTAAGAGSTAKCCHCLSQEEDSGILLLPRPFTCIATYILSH
jgi:hypothetical protein